MNDWIIVLLEEFGYIAVFCLILLENVFPPIPSEVILTFSGFMSVDSSLKVEILILIATLSSLLGAYFLYFIGSLFNKEKLIKFISLKYIRILGFKEKDILNTFKLFETRGNFIVFIGRCIPIIRSLISIPAGMNHMKLSSFTFYTCIGSLLWNTILIMSGSILKENWKIVTDIISSYSYILLILFIFIFCIIVLMKIRKQRFF